MNKLGFNDESKQQYSGGAASPSYQTTDNSLVNRSNDATFQTKFASLSLHMGDRIRLLDFPDPILQLVREAIQQTWPGGVQDEREYHGSKEFKLRGYPWHGKSSDGMHSRRLMCRIFRALFDQGWMLNLSTDVSKKVGDLDSLIFRFQDPTPAQCEWMCMSFSNYDQIRLIDAPMDLVQALIHSLSDKIQSHANHRSVDGAYELKFRGYPWNATGSDTMYARKLVLSLMQLLEAHGWTVYASIDQKRQMKDQRSETDTWHCCRAIGWSPGMPVFHR